MHSVSAKMNRNKFLGAPACTERFVSLSVSVSVSGPVSVSVSVSVRGRDHDHVIEFEFVPSSAVADLWRQPTG